MTKKEIIKEHLKLLPQKELLKLNRNLTEWYGEYYSQSDDKWIDMEALNNTTYEQVLNVLDEMVDLIITEYNKGGNEKEDLIIILYSHYDLLILINIILGGEQDEKLD